ncbi:hypothetical protein M407DRAFT_191509 [Tulasnella calospora MUT 4182]|uniref:Uncharacterized protein n=1 Tax=Tulasnella calospora MUT 4182 TaxID=1051891 RepID=A0A0C3QJN4_9AGAM|nr:hypothetical protein M407DRAFT_191509 [Tulasnella calospora MUT 4182]
MASQRSSRRETHSAHHTVAASHTKLFITRSPSPLSTPGQCRNPDLGKTRRNQLSPNRPSSSVGGGANLESVGQYLPSSAPAWRSLWSIG